ncbi:MBL fold metallo-hydrolase [bacterium]|nr:MBL fold metallo-hydrolase [bacterium]
MDFKITLLGTGTSTGVPLPGCACRVCQSKDPRDCRLRSSILISWKEELGECRALVDTTPDLRQQMLRYDFSTLDAVIYTHTHADHVFGIDDLRVCNFHSKTPLPIYTHQKSVSELQRMFSYIFSPVPDYPGAPPPQVELHQIEIGSEVILKNLTLQTIEVTHGQLQIMGLRIGNFAYMTDCSAVPAHTREALQGISILVVDGLRHRPHPTHFTIEQATEFAMSLGLKKAYLTHLSHDALHAETSEKLLNQTNGVVELAWDGLVIDGST